MPIQYSRILTKRSTVPGEVPTVPASNDHLDGSWLNTDIYKGELFINLPDKIVYSRNNDGIFICFQDGSNASVDIGAFKANLSIITSSSTPGDIVWNNAIQSNATQLFFAYVDRNGNSIGDFLDDCEIGDNIYLIGPDAGKFQKWKITLKDSEMTHQRYEVELVVSTYDFSAGENVNIIFDRTFLSAGTAKELMGDLYMGGHDIYNLTVLGDTAGNFSQNVSSRVFFDGNEDEIFSYANRANGINFTNAAGFKTFLKGLATANRTATFPDRDITVAGIDDIPALGFIGTSTQSGTGIATTFNVAHGLGSTPTAFTAHANSLDASNIAYTTADSTNVIIHYSIAPPTGTNNLKFTITARL